ncbi:UDP-glucose 6-dehydrogenase [Arenicella chitinivorans]|uniref:UDP-glucose 6-dehydrogenase n=1 Tax=Arenicella chitinivorans TaxID=1329800 RepID=A0A918VIR2_9GAMM|nr:UDP-glucose/GDP-mannose dehydrogenase family protein [Arenicella chitinivorans]GHA02076.1 UDP-glucose 6-dehydrogenase [Arenicella chitinivorans]
MNISIVGTGYVGLVTGTCFADVGNQVLCVDNNQSKIDLLLDGKIPIYEPGLEELVSSNIAQQRLQFTTDINRAVAYADIIFIAVGTPPDEDGSADLSHVLAVAKAIGQTLTDYRVIVTKSTVPVGTAAKVRKAVQAELDARAVNVEFSVASNPEFLKEGAAIDDFMKPDRVVIGADDDRAVELLRSLYAPFNRNHERLIVMDIPSAELTKYAANAMLATKISFMNELSNLAERLDADIELVRQGIGSDPRIGYHFIYPGCGYGGSCFPKDVQALHRTARQHGYNARILDAVEAVNQDQKSVLLDKIDAHFDGDLSGKTFAIWGLAFKPNTDDMREAPSRVIIDGLLARGAKVKAYDPVATEEASHIYQQQQDVAFAGDLYSATADADGLIVVTEWKAFRSPDFTRLKSQLRTPVIFDGRNIYEPAMLAQAGFKYYGIGRSN